MLLLFVFFCLIFLWANPIPSLSQYLQWQIRCMQSRRKQTASAPATTTNNLAVAQKNKQKEIRRGKKYNPSKCEQTTNNITDNRLTQVQIRTSFHRLLMHTCSDRLSPCTRPLFSSTGLWWGLCQWGCGRRHVAAEWSLLEQPGAQFNHKQRQLQGEHTREDNCQIRTETKLHTTTTPDTKGHIHSINHVAP